jgi:hypothetical protein
VDARRNEGHQAHQRELSHQVTLERFPPPRCRHRDSTRARSAILRSSSTHSPLAQIVDSYKGQTVVCPCMDRAVAYYRGTARKTRQRARGLAYEHFSLSCAALRCISMSLCNKENSNDLVSLLGNSSALGSGLRHNAPPSSALLSPRTSGLSRSAALEAFYRREVPSARPRDQLPRRAALTIAAPLELRNHITGT